MNMLAANFLYIEAQNIQHRLLSQVEAKLLLYPLLVALRRFNYTISMVQALAPFQSIEAKTY